MINWFLETFSTASEQAKLFSIVVSTALAVCLLLLNQWFNSRKSKKELLIKKIEELLTTIYAYERISLDILSNLFNSAGVVNQVTLDKMAESIEISDKLEMICVLYFPSINFNASEGQAIISQAHSVVQARAHYKHSKSSHPNYRSSTKKIKAVLLPLKEQTKALVKTHT